MIVTINEFRKLLELHEQPEFKFDDDSETKLEHLQFLDALQEIAKQTKFTGNFVSTGNYNTYLTNEVKQAAIKEQFKIPEGKTSYFLEFFKKYSIEQYPQYYSSAWFKKFQLPMTSKGLAKYNYTRFENILTAEGEKVFDFFVIQLTEIFLQEHGLIDALKKADSTGINIYRAINISGRNNYEWVIKTFKGAGLYWSFNIEGAHPHSGQFGTTYILCGKVRLQDINWFHTVYKTIHILRHEMEIEVNAGAIIELDQIVMKNNKKLPIQDKIYIRA